MKKVKIMLMAITVVAAVGGALAFKAKTVGLVKFCTAAAGTGNGNSCPNFLATSKIDASGPIVYAYKVTTGTGCTSQNCTDETTFSAE